MARDARNQTLSVGDFIAFAPPTNAMLIGKVTRIDAFTKQPTLTFELTVPLQPPINAFPGVKLATQVQDNRN
jgi:hypothetical protein